jgi:hypothetical protein
MITVYRRLGVETSVEALSLNKFRVEAAATPI